MDPLKILKNPDLLRTTGIIRPLDKILVMDKFNFKETINHFFDKMILSKASL